ncbi:MAG: tRNA (pseudouridine(54)-N(1))-methyltransferase TrmY [Thermoplasmata archaeon]|uniref:tRNA (pseudouridine(54)-N(1))-methyltransferase n=1 Tax=Candidatus Sysuiplasma superficiale TaxID=2823368 RepID=A0A8J7YSD9_9ARCH|nr:tRNA (pseudouridine(54)-N(1))-methyltransferase TrmY [Candidatus Sysuiplasma superficiale]MBX8643217.1 tRNA (pseudouridine(54)-N(1))-methyltransferase TrmY [Candidatus Sysuiplasma superficiale]MCL4346631.1 tRNA (pseudouridine(54)-N(1))-methyltransferase TrmY [Candidatus Thermoplasmatota archaeon]
MNDVLPFGLRRFVVFLHAVPTDGSFSLNDLPGSGGRVDVAARCVGAALLVSNGIRKDASVTFIFEGRAERALSVSVFGQTVRYLNPDERTTAALIKNALQKARKTESGFSSPGIYFRRDRTRSILEGVSENTKRYYLKEDGQRIGAIRQPATFFLGDNKDLDESEEMMMDDLGSERVSISGRSIHSDQCIVISNWIMDNGTC